MKEVNDGIPIFPVSNEAAALSGLSGGEVLSLRRDYGENRLPEDQPVTVWEILLNQLKSPLIYIILAAAAVSLILRETSDFYMIMAVVTVDIVLGFFQEYQAQRTYVSLKLLIRPTAAVIRDHQRKEVEVWELVPGDLVILKVGDKSPADGRLLEAITLTCDESILTGESDAVIKCAETPGSAEEDIGAAPPEAQVFMGTTILTGRGILQITRTGLNTELGKIAASLTGQPEEETPLQVRLRAFSKVLTAIVSGFTILILMIGLWFGHPFLGILRTSIILAVAAIPEGLLIAVTVILVLGMRKILKRRGLVKKLLAVETLGSVTVICTDKTGTLTEGRMRVSHMDFNHEERAFQTMVLCNNMENPVDLALWEYALKVDPDRPRILTEQSIRIGEELFTSEKKYMITVVTGGFLKEAPCAFLKGAPEIVLNMCSLPENEQNRIRAEIDQWADQGLRMIGLACRQGGILEGDHSYEWVGLLGMEDPIREGVAASIKLAQQAGIEIKMITGDYRRTADHIAEKIGLIREGALSLDGEEIAAMDDRELQHKVAMADVFSRIRPQEKLRIVKALQANGEITAMIGDGVNDAPALKKANIGVVVGSAADVAKETADLILLDNNFRTIVACIEEGRIIFENIRKVVAYSLSNSFAEVLAIFGAILFKWPAPLTVAQILWIHLICDGPSDIVLGFETKEDGTMNEKPRPLREPVLTRLGLVLIIIISTCSAAFVLLMYRHFAWIHGDPMGGRSIAFASFAINSMVYIFAYRSLRRPLSRMNPLMTNKPLILAVISGLLTALAAFLIPGLRKILGIVPLAMTEWLWIFGFALVLLLIVEAGKYVATSGFKKT
jgi:Ca2+-transporting ATPase